MVGIQALAEVPASFLESRFHRPCSVVRMGDVAQWLAGSVARGAEQVGL